MYPPKSVSPQGFAQLELLGIGGGWRTENMDKEKLINAEYSASRSIGHVVKFNFSYIFLEGIL